MTIKNKLRILSSYHNNNFEKKLKNNYINYNTISKIIRIFYFKFFVKILTLFFYLFFSTILTAQNINNNTISNILPDTNEKKNGKLSVMFDLIAYGRMSDLIEQTGNEDTLGVLFKGKINYVKKYKYANIEANFNGRIFEPLSHKARFYKDMSPPLFDFNEMNIAVVMKYGTVRIGVLEPYTKNIPMESCFPSLFYAYTISTNKVTVLSGPRDLPIGYETQFIPRYDTGLMYELSLFGLFLGVGVVNGEQGLDANSSKGLMAKISYSNNYFNFGVAGIVTEVGSIPIKEYNDSINAFFYFKNGNDGRLTVGVEGFWIRHGIRRLNEYSAGESNTNPHNYKNGYFTDFSIQTVGGENPFYAMSGFIFFEAKRLWKLDILTHIGVHDNNIFSNSEDIFQLKYRAFLRITFNITDDFKIILSDTFTYDPVFKNNYQYYELEGRQQLGVISYKAENGGHYTVDNDVYLGVSFTFGNY